MQARFEGVLLTRTALHFNIEEHYSGSQPGTNAETISVMSSSSPARILYVKRRRHWPRWLGAGGLTACAVAASMLWGGDDSDENPPATPRPHSAVPWPAPRADIASVAAPVHELPRAAPAHVVAAVGTPAIDLRTPARPRIAVDSGREQPVFLGLAGPAAARIGQTFTLQVTAESENEFAAGTLVVDFDPARLTFSTLRAGQFMARAGAMVRTTYAVDARIGRLTVRFAEAPGGPPVSGGGALLDIDFVATSRGDTTATLSSATLRDLDNVSVGTSTMPAHALTVSD
jgi:hypothetical protein